MKPSYLFVILFSLLMTGSIAAETFYVSPSGFNNRPRWQARNRNLPWRTIQHGLNNANPGDTVVVMDGRYWENAYFPRSGNAGNPITLEAEGKWGPEIIGSVRGDDKSYLRVLGLRVTNRRQDAPITKGISFNRCHNLTIRDNEVYYCRGGGISVDQSDSILIEWNVAHHNAFWNPGQHSGISVYQPQRRGPGGSGFGVVIRNNTSYENSNKVNNPLFGRPTDGNGVVIDDTMNISAGGNGVSYDRGVLITNNLCFENGGQGVHCYQSEGVYIRNNTCFNNLIDFDFGGEVSVSRSKRVFVYNNILHARGDRNVALKFESENVWFDYNLLNDRPSFDVRHGRNTIYASRTIFAADSFRLDPYNEGIDRGLTHPNIFHLGVYGGSRVTGFGIDIGASEYAGF
jgi:parallel beta-helix repeat protein